MPLFEDFEEGVSCGRSHDLAGAVLRLLENQLPVSLT